MLRGKQRLKGNRAKGKTYERKVIKDFQRANLAAEVLASPWFNFVDYNGLGWCQPDILLIQKHCIIIVEVKLTQTSAAWQQLELLYKPVVEKHYGLPTYLLQVCKNLQYEVTAEVNSIEEFLDAPRRGLWTLHYLT